MSQNSCVPLAISVSTQRKGDTGDCRVKTAETAVSPWQFQSRHKGRGTWEFVESNEPKQPCPPGKVGLDKHLLSSSHACQQPSSIGSKEKEECRSRHPQEAELSRVSRELCAHSPLSTICNHQEHRPSHVRRDSMPNSRSSQLSQFFPKQHHSGR